MSTMISESDQQILESLRLRQLTLEASYRELENFIASHMAKKYNLTPGQMIADNGEITDIPSDSVDESADI